ncbi:diacylglycerol kinase family protein [Anaerorudis cellulosivorans]|uniref:diacylglycerol kinase family protein n=1 Tax=Anaerorudis cellulosivorans TaxID=3397862 RepID=UPI002220F043|nr:diacylglycerol kinase family protein [Seramator thermalis]MCW1735103.1 diacylglycerol kinase family protein [Seramator thermalis]
MNRYFHGRIQSFRFAFRGLRTLFRETPNARIELVMALLAVALGFLLHISATEWLAICIVIGMVPACEALNTAIERLSDYVSQHQKHPIIRKVKDVAAAGVLIAAIAALAVGILIFLPKLVALL